MHCTQEVGPSFDRERNENIGIGNVVFERSSLFGTEGSGSSMEMPHQVTFAISANSIAKNQVMHTTADIDRINLNIAVMNECVTELSDGFVEQQRSTHEAPGGQAGDSQNETQVVRLSRVVRKKQGAA